MKSSGSSFKACMIAQPSELHGRVAEVALERGAERYRRSIALREITISGQAAHVGFSRPLRQPSAHSTEAALRQTLRQVVVVSQEGVIALGPLLSPDESPARPLNPKPST